MLEQPLDVMDLAYGRKCFVRDIWSVRIPQDDMWPPTFKHDIGNAINDLRWGSGRECQDLIGMQFIKDVWQIQIGGSESLSPLDHRMRFVYDD